MDYNKKLISLPIGLAVGVLIGGIVGTLFGCPEIGCGIGICGGAALGFGMMALSGSRSKKSVSKSEA